VEKRIERIKEALHDARYKLTPQREVTVRVLLENESSHLSAEDVFMKVKDKYRKSDWQQSTVRSSS
jgi:Fe2+/Zn2+ uptake regulation proteins